MQLTQSKLTQRQMLRLIAQLLEMQTVLFCRSLVISQVILMQFQVVDQLLLALSLLLMTALAIAQMT